MRARDIHAAAEVLTGEALRWTSVKAALAAGTSSRTPRFQRVRPGIYQRARLQGIEDGSPECCGYKQGLDSTTLATAFSEVVPACNSRIPPSWSP